MLKEILLAPIIGVIVLGIWHFRLERYVKKFIRGRLEKEAENEKAIFIDPR